MLSRVLPTLPRTLNKLKPATWLKVYYSKQYSTTQSTQPPKSSTYADAFNKFEGLQAIPKEQPQTFASLLKNSKLIDLGDPEGKVVTGRVFHVVDNDLYVDFGWKFHCVCPRPKKNASDYVRGAKVRLRVKHLELSSKFLGCDKDLTLLEADCHLLGLIRDRREGKNV